MITGWGPIDLSTKSLGSGTSLVWPTKTHVRYQMRSSSAANTSGSV